MKVKMIIITIMVLSLFSGCVSYNPNYMESKTTQERLVDVAMITIYGSIIGASITYNLMEP